MLTNQLERDNFVELCDYHTHKAHNLMIYQLNESSFTKC